MLDGVVVKNTGSWYSVKTAENRVIDCKIKGNFRIKDIKTTNPIAVGDFVQVEQSPDGSAVIANLCDRRNFIVRRSTNLARQTHILAANLDLVALVVTVNYPETSTVFIDRFLASAEAYEVPACLIFNKIDAYNEAELEYLSNLIFLYQNIGYQTFKVSALDENSLSELNLFLKNKITLLAGNSGVGKSTIINALIKNLNLKTAKISSYHNKGMHTTTFSQMFDIQTGGSIIDTPGIKGFGTIDFKDAEVGHYFKEIFKFSKNCRFSNCTHTGEPDCAVKSAVEQQFISQSRYKSYMSILQDAKEGKYRE